MGYALKLLGFAMQIHQVNWEFLGIRNYLFWPGTPDKLHYWVNLFLPHEDNSPEAQAERERPWTDPMRLAHAIVSWANPGHPPKNPFGIPFPIPAPTSATYPPTTQRPMPALAPAPRQPHTHQPQQSPSQKPGTNNTFVASRKTRSP
ncbi:hypothetical protein PG993_009350 [Apiospora rasikravindrae]|uniref:Uncharacterized protein n=1 Tax=Apiospora rasikravindrae TaxID=990691 RepID=A0ABR1SKW2_9PEZI